MNQEMNEYMNRYVHPIENQQTSSIYIYTWQYNKNQ